MRPFLAGAWAVPSSTTEFSELLRRFRLASGVSQESLAERARMSASAIGALERGARRAPYRETVALLADALGLSPAERIEFEGGAERERGRKARPRAEMPATHNLPSRLTSFVGREKEIAEIQDLSRAQRLVTVTGSGGVGKTRTAVEAARQLFDEGHEDVRFVDLSPVDDGAFVAGAIGSALGIPVADGPSAIGSLAAMLKTRKLLLIVDNCEHVVADAAATAGAVVRGCAGITILATSRERLAIEGEFVYRLPSMPVPARPPATFEEARAFSSFQLFIERARASGARLELDTQRLRAAAEICGRLDGIPLAIELVATRVPALGLGALNDRLKEHFLTTQGARDLPSRQRTMFATIAWSYDLLGEAEQTFLRRLAIFRGGATLKAVEAVCADETLGVRKVVSLVSSLVAKSLLNVTSIDRYERYVMLESVRSFAAAKLAETDELAKMAKAHAEWLANLGDRTEEHDAEISPSGWSREFAGEIDNARAALAWALNSGSAEDGRLAAKIVGGLRGLWVATDRMAGISRWAEAASSRIDETDDPLVAARLVRTRMQAASGYDALAFADDAIALFERSGDIQGLIWLHGHIAGEYGVTGAFDQAERAIARAFELATGEGMESSLQYLRLLQMRCAIRAYQGCFDEARRDLASRTGLERTLGGEVDAAFTSYWEAYIEFGCGAPERAAELLEATVEHARASLRSPAGQLGDLAATRIALGDIDAAYAAAHEALELGRLGRVDVAWQAIQNLAAVASLRGRARSAARLAGFVNAFRERNKRFSRLLRARERRDSSSVTASSAPSGRNRATRSEGGAARSGDGHRRSVGPLGPHHTRKDTGFG